MPVKLDGEKIVVSEGDENYELERVKSYGYRDLSQETTQPPTITPITSVEDIIPEILTYTHDGSANNQTTYSVTFNEEVVADILIVGGGGAGSQAHGGGGGAGAVIFMKDVTLNGNYEIKVGKGGIAEGTTGSGTAGIGNKGEDTEIYKSESNKVTAEGGGGGGQDAATGDGGNGGSGGGGDAYNNPAAGLKGLSVAYTPILDGVTGIKYGNDGGTASGNPGSGGGGGGAGGAGGDGVSHHPSDGVAGPGGIGIYKATISNIDYNFKTHFNIGNTNIGEHDSNNVYFGGGGGAGSWGGSSIGSLGGLGGGGNGGEGNINTSQDEGEAGKANTGGGGGGGGDHAPIGGNGGSGIVIIKVYKAATHKKVTLKYDYTEDKKYPSGLTNSDNLKVWYKFDAVPTNGATLTNYGTGGSTYDATLNITSDGIERLDGFNVPYRYYWKSDAADGNYISVPANILQSLYENGHTISFWGKDASTSDSDYTVIATNSTGSGSDIYIRIHTPWNNNNVYFDNGNGASNYSRLNGASGTSANELVFWTFTRENISSTQIMLKIYKNGIVFLSNTFTRYDFDNSSISSVFYIGYNTNSSFIFKNKSLEDFRIYDKTLTETEINELYMQSIVARFKDPSNSSAIAASKNWKLISYEPSEDNWFPDGLLNDIPSDRYLAFIYEDSGTLTWVMLQKSVIEGNHNWSTYSVPTGHGSISSIGRYNDELETGSQAPIITTTTNVQSSSHFIYREESSSTWHSTPPANRRYYVLEEVIQTEYTITFPTPRLCDILIVGGGGGGSEAHGGGGGAGSVIFLKDVNMNGNYTIKVGRGGGVSENIGNDGIGFKGIDSEIYKSNSNKVIAEGGGAGGAFANGNGGDGGSGGGGDGYIPTYSSGTFYPSGGSANVYTPVLEGITGVKYGNVGGSGFNQNAGTGGGGGGAGAAGESATAINDNSVYGGVGIYKATISGVDYKFKELFGLPNDNSVGEYHPGGAYAGSTYDSGVYFGGGGGGSLWENPEPTPSNVVGGLGGGGTSGGYTPTIDAENGLANSGGGGGGGGSGGGDGGAGGSGVVIIRYRAYGVPYDAQWKHHKKLPNIHFYGNVGIGTYANNNKLYVNGNINITGDYYKNNKILTEWYNSTNSNIYKNYGNVGIGTAIPNYKLHVEGQLYAAQGGTSGTGNTSWTTTSDMHVKDNITKASYVKCYNNINNIELYRFNYKPILNNTRDNNQLGFIAQEVEGIFPKSVKRNKMILNNQEHEVLALDVTQINYTLFGAVKYLAEKVEALKQKVNNIN